METGLSVVGLEKILFYSCVCSKLMVDLYIAKVSHVHIEVIFFKLLTRYILSTLSLFTFNPSTGPEVYGNFNYHEIKRIYYLCIFPIFGVRMAGCLLSFK